MGPSVGRSGYIDGSLGDASITTGADAAGSATAAGSAATDPASGDVAWARRALQTASCARIEPSCMRSAPQADGAGGFGAGATLADGAGASRGSTRPTARPRTAHTSAR